MTKKEQKEFHKIMLQSSFDKTTDKMKKKYLKDNKKILDKYKIKY